jgi:dTMP kinase
MQQLKRGILVTVEGIDGAGKSTIIKALHAQLVAHGMPTILTKEPGSSPLGMHIRSIVHERTIPVCVKAEFLLFAADRAQHMHDIVIPGLTTKHLVLSDRMADSSLVYQGYGNGIELSFIQTVNQWTMNNVLPDLTIFIKIPVSVAQQRIAARGNVSYFEKQSDLLKRVDQGFEEIFARRNNVMRVDGTLSINMIVQNIYMQIKDWLCQQQLLV